jgi:parallel beta-helix repeat protein
MSICSRAYRWLCRQYRFVLRHQFDLAAAIKRSEVIAPQRFRAPVGFEPLEPRQMLSTVTWTGAANNGLWSTAGNWDVGVPQNGDDVVIPQTATPSVHFNAAAPAVTLDGLNITASDFAVDGSHLTLSGANAFIDHGASFSLNGGTLTLDSNLDTVGDFVFNGGTLDGTAALTTEGLFHFQTSNNPTVSTVTVNMTNGVVAGGNITLDDGAVINVAGGLALDTSQSILFGGNGAAPQINIIGSLDSTSSITTTIASGIAVTNSGSINLVVGNLAIGNLTNYNAGTQTLTSGAFQVLNSSVLTIPGDIHTDAATLGLAGGTVRNATTGLSALTDLTLITAGGTLDVTQQNLSFSGSLTNNGNIGYDGGTLTLAGGSGTLTNNVFFNHDGVLVIDGNLVNNGTFTGGLASPGNNTTEITGNYSASSGAFTSFLTRGTTPATDFVVLTIDGSAALAGTFGLNAFNGFIPADGDTFTFIHFTNAPTGNFTAGTSFGLAAGQTVQRNLTSASFTAEIVGGAQQIVVTNTNDSGAGSLRQAIIDANVASSDSDIVFHIPASDPNFIDTDSAITGGDAGKDVFRIRPLTALPALDQGNLITIKIDGSTQTAFGGNTNALGPEIFLDGTSAAGASGIELENGLTQVRGLIISNFDGEGVFINGASGQVVAANYIGTDPSGTISAANTSAGIFIQDGSNNVIGGDFGTDGNLVSGNSAVGVNIQGSSSDNVLEGNIIGLDRTGSIALSNAFQGVFISAADNTVGGAGFLQRNVISGNSANGVAIAGTGATGNVVQGNFIGTDKDGLLPVGNAFSGVYVGDRSSFDDGSITGVAINNLIGVAGNGNVISGNGFAGIIIFGDGGITNETIKGNSIGADSNGDNTIGNSADGIDVLNASNNVIGGAAGAGNIIADNGGAGVDVEGNSVGNLVSLNSIFANTGLGIDLGDDGLDAIDATDADTGPNDRLNSPVITGITTQPNGGATDLLVTLHYQGLPNTFLNLEFYGNDDAGAGEGGQFLVATSSLTTDGSGSFNGVFNVGSGASLSQFVTVAAVDPSNNNTSEFSNAELPAAETAGDGTLITTTGDVDHSDIASNAGGDTVVVWATQPQSPDFNATILAQRFDSAGAKVGSEITVSTIGNSEASDLSVAMDNNGEFVVAWTQDVGVNNDDVKARVFNSDGTARSAVLTVNSVTAGLQSLDGLAMAGNGSWVASLENRSAVDDTATALFYRRFTLNGAARDANQVRFDDAFGGGSSTIDGGGGLSMDQAGNFIATYARENSDGSSNVVSQEVLFKLFSQAGVQQGAERTAFTNTDLTNVSLRGSGAFLTATGDAHVGWDLRHLTGGAAGGSELFIANFDASGNLTKSPVSVVAPAANIKLDHIDATLDADGNFGLVWTVDDTANSELTSFFQPFSNSLVAAGPAVQLGNPAEQVAMGGIAGTGAGEATVAWVQGDTLATSSDGALGNVAIQQVTIPSNVLLVTNTNDTGAGSLRQAITDANAATVDVTIKFNIPASDPNFIDTDSGTVGGDAGKDTFRIRPQSALPAITNSTARVTIDGTSQTAFGGNTNGLGPEVLVNGFQAGNTNGLLLFTDSTTIRGLVINDFQASGILISGSGNTVDGNYIGIDPSGTFSEPNGDSGVSVLSGAGNTIGTTLAADRNVISGNTNGVSINPAASSTTVAGNFIGTDASGVNAIANVDGIFINSSANNTLDGNLISGNDAAGVFLSGSGANTISGNMIGLGANGLAIIPNDYGIQVTNPTGTVVIDSNFISGNFEDGIEFKGDNGSITNNSIGVGSDDGVAGNGVNGVAITGSDNVVSDNFIGFNGDNGVDVFSGIDNRISGNFITGNGGKGIDLGNNGVTQNDAGDIDTGPNNLINFPEIDNAVLSTDGTNGSYHVEGVYDGPANSTITLEFFASFAADASGFGEGNVPLGTVSVDTNGAGHATFSADFESGDNGPIVTATATDADGNTSEFSEALPASIINLGPTFSISDVTIAEGNAGSKVATFTVTLSSHTVGPATVHFATASGTATAGSDFTAASGTLSFPVGTPSKTVSVTIKGDSLIESDETFTVALSAPSANAGLSSTDSVATGTILNDDGNVSISSSIEGSVAFGDGSVGFPVSIPTAEAALTNAGKTVVSVDLSQPVTVSTLFLSRNVSLSGAALTNVRDFLANGGTVITEFTETALWFDGTLASFSGNRIDSFFQPISGRVDGNLVVTKTDPNSFLTAGLPNTFISDDSIGVFQVFTGLDPRISTPVKVKGTSDGDLPVVGSAEVPGGGHAVMFFCDFADNITVPAEKLLLINATAGGIATVTEGQDGEFTLSRDTTTVGDLVVKFAVSGKATRGKDYVLKVGGSIITGNTITIPDGQSSVTVVMSSIDDTLPELTERVTLTLVADATYPLTDNLADRTASIAILDNESTVGVTASDNEAAESGLTPSDTGSFTISRSGGSNASDLVVNFTMSGPAVRGKDYTLLFNDGEAGSTLLIGNSITIPAGQDSVVVTLSPIDDSLVEPSEAAVLTLSANAALYTLDPDAKTATVVIDDNEPVVSIAATDPAADENGGTGTFRITRIASTIDAPLVVNFTRTGSAASVKDYILQVSDGEVFITLTGNSVTIPAGAAFVDVVLVPVDDTLPEPTEAATLVLAKTAAYTVDPDADSASVAIADNEPTISITATNPTASEDGDNATFLVSRNGGTLVGDLVVNFTVAGSATRTKDYVLKVGSDIITSNFVTIPDGDSSVLVTLVAVDDSLPEPTESAVITLAKGATYTVDSELDQATATITDNEPTISVSSGDDASEDGDTGSFTVTRSGGTTVGDLVVNFAMSGNATRGKDYTLRVSDGDGGFNDVLGNAVTIPDGQASVVVVLVPIDDSLPEPTEQAVLTIVKGTTYTVDPEVHSAVVNIADNEPDVSVTALEQTASESGTTSTFTVTRSGGTIVGDLVVNFSMAGSATRGKDYFLRVSDGGGAAAAPLGEGPAESPAFITIDGNTVTIPDGQASIDIELVPIDDSLPEPTETALFKLAAGPTYTVNSDQASAAIDIADNEPLIGVFIAGAGSGGDHASESGTPASLTSAFTITRSGGTVSGDLPVKFTLSGNAARGKDYLLQVDTGEGGLVTVLGNTVVIPDGQSSVNLIVAPIDDGLIEATETVKLTVAPSAIYTVDLGSRNATMFIDDNEPTISVFAFDDTASEAGDPGTFRISRDASNNLSPATVFYKISGTASNGGDYTFLDGVAVIPAGADFIDVTVAPLDDPFGEGDETVVLTLLPNKSYTLTSDLIDRTAVVTLADDEPTVGIAAITATATEGGAPGVVRVTRTGPTGLPLTVFLARSGSASDDDIVDLGLLTIIPAGRAFVDVNVTALSDNTTEGDETVTLSIFPLFGAGIDAGNASATVTIVDAAPAPNPDLIMTRLELVPDQEGGVLGNSAVHVFATIRTQGGVDAPATTLEFRRSRDPLLSGSDPVIGTAAIPALAAGEEITIEVIIDESGDRVGASYILAELDKDHLVSGEDTTNNLFVTPIANIILNA